MSNRKPSKVWIYFCAFAVLACAGLAAFYFIAGKPLLGGIWTFNSCCWVYSAAVSARTYRLRLETAQRVAELERRYGGRR